MTVGIVGLGAMGLPMALKLLEAGFDVIGRGRRGAHELVEAGGQHADSVAELASSAEVIITCLPDADALEAVTAELAASASPGLVVAETSVLRLEWKRQSQRILADVGVTLLDCPTSGTPVQIRTGRLAVFASGDETAYRLVLPYLEAFCGAAPYVGDFGAGTRTKAVAQMMGALHNVAAAVGVRVAEAAGLDAARTVDVLAASAASSWFWEFRGPRMAARDFSPAGGTLADFLRSLEVVDELLKEAGVDPQVFRAARDIHEWAAAEGRGADDVSCIVDSTILSERSA